MDLDPDGLSDAGLVIGVPGESAGSLLHAGGVTVLTPLGAGYSYRSYGDSAGRVAGERYGMALPSLNE